MIHNVRVDDSDAIILQSVESRLKELKVPMNMSPQEKIAATQQVRDYLYSDIVKRVPRVVRYIMAANLETNDVARGLNIALNRHAMDPAFVDLLLQYLGEYNNADDNAIVGAYLCQVIDKFIESNTKASTSTDKKKIAKAKAENTSNDNNDVDNTTIDIDTEQIMHLHKAVKHLLGDIIAVVETRCVNLNSIQSMAVASFIAMDNNDTIYRILEADLPVTASIFDVLTYPGNIIKSALLIEKEKVVKAMSDNQKRFLESLKKWVYNKLDIIPAQQCYIFITSVYGTCMPDANKYYIQLKDCGKQYSNLKTVVNSMSAC